MSRKGDDVHRQVEQQMRKKQKKAMRGGKLDMRTRHEKEADARDSQAIRPEVKCERCGCWLRSGNHGPLCAPCRNRKQRGGD